MGKIRTTILGNEDEQEQQRKADARREGKKERSAFAKATAGHGKQKIEGVGLKGGERSSVVEGLDEEAMQKLAELAGTEQSRSESKPTGDETDETGKKKAKKRTPGEPKKRSKRYKEALSLVDRAKFYPISDALALVKKTSLTRFDGSVEVHITIDTKGIKSTTIAAATKDKESKKAAAAAASSLRGTVQFPHGTGKQVRVAIADEALIAQVEGGKIEFDVLIAHPSMMPKLARVARVLGPKGLMPNPKTGTVTDDPEAVAKKFSGGQVAFKTEPDNPLIHLALGKVSFESGQLKDNLSALVKAIGKTKVIKVTVSSTMGPGIKVDLTTL